MGSIINAVLTACLIAGTYFYTKLDTQAERCKNVNQVLQDKLVN